MSGDVIRVVLAPWRSLAFGLAAALFCASLALGQGMPLADRIKLCGGCHVRNTGEIGRLAVARIRSEGKRNKRVTLTLA